MDFSKSVNYFSSFVKDAEKRYEVVWAEVAEGDLKEIIEYIAIDSPQNALQILKKIR